MKPLNAKNADIPTPCRPSIDTPLLHITSANTAGMTKKKAAISNTNSTANLKMLSSATILTILLMTHYSMKNHSGPKGDGFTLPPQWVLGRLRSSTSVPVKPQRPVQSQLSLCHESRLPKLFLINYVKILHWGGDCSMKEVKPTNRNLRSGR